MAYKSVQQSELMAHEFARVEGAFHHLDEKALKEAMPAGTRLELFKDQLRQGHMVLLTDTPAVPLLVQESGGLGQRTWAVNPKAQSLVTPTGQKALLARTQMRGRASGVSQNLPPPPPLHYVPEPALPDSTEEAPSLKYEYSVEVAGSQASFRKNIGAHFVLAKTAEEGMLGRWMDSQTEHGTLYTVLTAFNEPKNLLAHVANIPMGISPKHPVKVRALGSRTAYEAFIPVSPTMQVGERLGLPTQGYYYHFHRHALVQEYRIIGDGNWGYYATASQPHQLNTERGYNTDQTAILVYWKLGGKVCDNQHLVYLPRPITLEELSNVNEDWLLTHGVKLDINQLLATQSHAIVERASTDEQSQAPPEPINHIVARDPNTGERESWMQIAEQYGLTPKALLALNPAYDANPMSLAVGHSLNVKVVEASQKESLFDTPPVPMGTYNHALNVHYDFSERFLSGTHIQSINSERLLSDDIPVVRLADFTPNRVFAKSCEQPEGCIDAGVSDEPITHFGPWAFFFGQAHANPMVGRAIQTQQAIQAAQTQTALATSGGMVGDNLREKPLSELDKAGIQLEKVAGNLAESWLEGYRLKSPTIGALFILGQQLYGDDTQYTDDELRQEKTVQSRVRIHLTDPKEGEYYPSVRAYHTDDTRIPVRYAREENGQYSVMLEGDQPLVWTPIDEGDPSWQTTPDHDDGFEPDSIVVTPIPDTENATTTLPIPEEGDWRDTVVVFPESTGIPPLYVVYTQQPRDEKGQFASTGEPKPKLDRPKLRAETKRQIEASTEKREGQFIDDKGNVLTDWQYGHVHGKENRRVVRAAEELGMSQQELNDFMNSRPDYYQIEDRITNLSHVNEKPGYDDLDDIQDDMIEFLEERSNR